LFDLRFLLIDNAVLLARYNPDNGYQCDDKHWYQHNVYAIPTPVIKQAACKEARNTDYCKNREIVESLRFFFFFGSVHVGKQ
jgi:hypothetical protein